MNNMKTSEIRMQHEPRKFEDKIAVNVRNQADGGAQFHEIIEGVTHLKRAVSHIAPVSTYWCKYHFN
jgi:hypothetical protein